MSMATACGRYDASSPAVIQGGLLS